MADPIDPAFIKAKHWNHHEFDCKSQYITPQPGRCLPYRLAVEVERLAGKVKRVEALLGPDEGYRNEFKHLLLGDVRAELADQPEQAQR